MVTKVAFFVLGLAFGLTFTTSVFYGNALFYPAELHQEAQDL